jgi:hypothetical protein
MVESAHDEWINVGELANVLKDDLRELAPPTGRPETPECLHWSWP